MGWTLIDTRPTPNPNATKYVFNRSVAEASTSFLEAHQAKGHPIAEKLFEIDGVTGVLLLGDFVTINKNSGARWADIARQVKKVFAEA